MPVSKGFYCAVKVYVTNKGFFIFWKRVPEMFLVEKTCITSLSLTKGVWFGKVPKDFLKMLILWWKCARVPKEASEVETSMKPLNTLKSLPALARRQTFLSF